MTPTHISLSSKLVFRSLAIVAVSLFAFLMWQQSDASPKNSSSLFSWLKSQEVKTLQLELPLDSIYNKVDEDLPATLSWEENWGGQKQLPLEVQLRGNSRKNLCDFPPIKLELDEPVKVDGQWFNAGKYKLVTHCLADSSDDRVLKEWMAYQMYETLTPQSFQTHLIEVEYVDSEGKHPSQKAFAFLIETKEELAERLNLTLMEKEESIDYLQASSYHLFTVFQLMIGNTDWNLKKRHNVKLFQDEEGRVIPVPYDFDQSGLVNATYAQPHPSLPIESVTDRYFQWRGKKRTQLQPTLEFLEDQKASLLAILTATPGLDQMEQMRIKGYLSGFFENLDLLISSNDRLVEMPSKQFPTS